MSTLRSPSSGLDCHELSGMPVSFKFCYFAMRVIYILRQMLPGRNDAFASLEESDDQSSLVDCPTWTADLFAVTGRIIETWPAADSEDAVASFSSFFKLHRADISQRRMTSRRIIGALNVIKHV